MDVKPPPGFRFSVLNAPGFHLQRMGHSTDERIRRTDDALTYWRQRHSARDPSIASLRVCPDLDKAPITPHHARAAGPHHQTPQRRYQVCGQNLVPSSRESQQPDRVGSQVASIRLDDAATGRVVIG